MRILGIDPGLSGAFVILDNGTPIEWGTMPVMVEGTNKRVNGAALAAQWRWEPPPDWNFASASGEASTWCFAFHAS